MGEGGGSRRVMVACVVMVMVVVLMCVVTGNAYQSNKGSSASASSSQEMYVQEKEEMLYAEEFIGRSSASNEKNPISSACARINSHSSDHFTDSRMTTMNGGGGLSAFEWEFDAVLCYAGTFMSKMLSELNSGDKSSSAKSPEHVHLHLQPYLGGQDALTQLLKGNENADNATCFVCYEDTGAANGLMQLRETVSVAALKAYDAIDVCVYDLAAAIVISIPKEQGGRLLKPLPPPTSTSSSSSSPTESEERSAIEAAQIIMKAVALVGVNGCKNNHRA